MAPEEVGLWFVFITLVSFAQVLEFGFQPTLARNAAYIHAGAQKLTAEGINKEKGPLNTALLADLLAASRWIYRRIAGLVAAVLLIPGTLYVISVLPERANTTEILIGWMGFALGSAFNLYYGYFAGLLQGRGDWTSVNKILICSRGGLVILGSILVTFDFGLFGLGVAALICSLAARRLAHRYYFDEKRPETPHLLTRVGEPRYLVKILWHNARRLGMASFGAFLILRANILVASSFLGLKMAASYGLSMQLFMVLSSMAAVFSNVQLPRMNAIQVKQSREELREVFGAILIVSWGLFLSGTWFFLTLGDWVLAIIGSKTQLLPLGPMVFLAMVMLLELNHSVSATYLTTTNHVPFVAAALWSGLGVTFLTVTLMTLTGLGVWALIVGQGIVQLVYNNWKWPIMAIDHLGGNSIGLLRAGSIDIRRLMRSPL